MIALRKARDGALAEQVAGALFSCLSRSGDQVQYTNDVEFDALTPILVDLLSYPRSWEKSEILRFVRRGIINAKKEGLEKFENIIVKANAESTELFAAPEQLYKMWTKISLTSNGSKSLVFRIRGIHVRISKTPHLRLDLKPYFINGLGEINPHTPQGGMFITASGKFRSSDQAGHGLYKAISNVINLLNFAQHNHIRQIKFGKVRPKSNVLLGENQYLFRIFENLNTEQIWYNPQFNSDHWQTSRQDFDPIAQFAPYVRRFLKRLSKLSFGERILSSLDMMVDSWSSTDMNYRVLRSWTAYELLLSRSQDRADNHEDVARRAVFIAKNKQFLLLRLKHAARSRNKYVHENADILGADGVLNGIESYFLQLISWIVFQKVPFESHEQLVSIFDMSTDVRVLKSQLRQHIRALKIKES